MVLTFVYLSIAALVAALAFWGLVQLERRDRPEVAVVVIVAIILAQGVLFPTESRVPVGPFRPGAFRITELLIVGALAARVLVRGMPWSLSWTGLAWLAFFVWYAAEAVLGFLRGNDTELILFHGKSIVYVGGAMALVAGVPLSRLVRPRVFRRATIVVAAVVLALVPLSLARLNVSIPPLGVTELGRIGPDVASLFVAAGAIALLVESSRRARWLSLTGMLLFLSPFLTRQRASVIHIVGILVVLLVATLGATWRRRIRATPTELALALTGLLAAGVIGMLFFADEDEIAPPAFESIYEETFAGVGNVQSADARRLRWDEAQRLAGEQPILGWGLGSRYDVVRPGLVLDVVEQDLATFDNIVWDLMVRSGLVGLGLFSFAIALSLRDGWRGWRRHPSPALAALSLACAAAVAGLVAKGLVESVLEKSVIMISLGLMVGVMIRVAGGSDDEVEDTTGGDERDMETAAGFRQATMSG